MKRYLILLTIITVIILFTTFCGKEEEVDLTTSYGQGELQPVYYLARVNANLLEKPLPNPIVESIEVDKNPKYVNVTVLNKGVEGKILVTLQIVDKNDEVQDEFSKKVKIGEGLRAIITFKAPKKPDEKYVASAIPLETPKIIRMINQGDELSILERKESWSKVMHLKTETVGWLNNEFIYMEERSKWYSGDTEKARTIAKQIYLDKRMAKYPIVHVNIEERFKRIVLQADKNKNFPKKEATECAKIWLNEIIKKFPEWSTHHIFIYGKENGQSYTLVMKEKDKQPIFL